jgi:hypothetical protein
MHNAPSVSYPVGRCAFQRRLYVVFTVLMSAVLLIWALNQGLGWMWWFAACVFVLGTYLGWHSLRRAGTLTWDGHAWCLHDQGLHLDDALGEVSVSLDLQNTLLLCWRPTSDTLHTKSVFLWLGVEHSVAHWQDLRRAVYQRKEMN